MQIELNMRPDRVWVATLYSVTWDEKQEKDIEDQINGFGSTFGEALRNLAEVMETKQAIEKEAKK